VAWRSAGSEIRERSDGRHPQNVSFKSVTTYCMLAAPRVKRRSTSRTQVQRLRWRRTFTTQRGRMLPTRCCPVQLPQGWCIADETGASQPSAEVTGADQLHSKKLCQVLVWLLRGGGVLFTAGQLHACFRFLGRHSNSRSYASRRASRSRSLSRMFTSNSHLTRLVFLPSRAFSRQKMKPRSAAVGSWRLILASFEPNC
jgi:hypothetical protein